MILLLKYIHFFFTIYSLPLTTTQIVHLHFLPVKKKCCLYTFISVKMITVYPLFFYFQKLEACSLANGFDYKKQESVILIAFLPLSMKHETGFKPYFYPINNEKKRGSSTTDLCVYNSAHIFL